MIQASAVSINSGVFHRKKHWIRVSLVSDDCSIAGYLLFVSLFQTNCTLKTFNLSYNGFSNDGAVALGEAVRANNTLLELDIRFGYYKTL